MTIPTERSRAVLAARRFLFDLLDPKKTPRVSRSVRLRAIIILRHYPGVVDIERAARKAPDIFGKLEE